MLHRRVCISVYIYKAFSGKVIHYICYLHSSTCMLVDHIRYHLAQKFIMKLRIDCLIDTQMCFQPFLYPIAPHREAPISAPTLHKTVTNPSPYPIKDTQYPKEDTLPYPRSDFPVKSINNPLHCPIYVKNSAR
jgi:hypothetical protein